MLGWKIPTTQEWRFKRLTVGITILAAWSTTFTVKLLFFYRPEPVTVIKTVEIRQYSKLERVLLNFQTQSKIKNAYKPVFSWVSKVIRVYFGFASIRSVIGFNLLSPNSDKHLISPYNITTWSSTRVMRIKEMITKR